MAFHLPPINFSSNTNRNPSSTRNASLDRLRPAQLFIQNQFEVGDVSRHHQKSPSLIQLPGLNSPLQTPREIDQVISTYSPMGNKLHNFGQQQIPMQSRRSSSIQGFIQDQPPRRATLFPLTPLQQDSPLAFPQSYSPRNFPIPQFETQSLNVLQPRNESTFKRAHNQMSQDSDGFEALLERHTRRQSILLMGMASALNNNNSPKADQRVSLPSLTSTPTSKRPSYPTLENLRKEEESVQDNSPQFFSQQRRQSQFNPEAHARKSTFGNDMLQALFKARLEHENKKHQEDSPSDTESGYGTDNDSLYSPRSENSAQQTPKSESKRNSGSSLLSVPYKKSSFYSNEGLQKQDLDVQIQPKKSSFRLEKPSEREPEPKNEQMIQKLAVKRANWKLVKERGSIIVGLIDPQEEEKEERTPDFVDLEGTKKTRNIFPIEKEEQIETPKIKKKKKATKQKKQSKILDNHENKEKTQNKIKVAMWLTIFIPLVFRDKKQYIDVQRVHVNENVAPQIPGVCSSLKSWIIDHAGKEILTLLTNKQFNLIFVSTKVLPEKRLEKDCTTLKDQLQLIFANLVKNLSSLSKNFLKFLSGLSKDEALLPNMYFSEFELSRLQFGYFGTLKEMTIEQANLICAGIAIIRVLIHSIIMEPWNAFHLSQEKFDTEKIFNVGSVMYNIAMELLKSTANVINSQQRISPSYKIQPKKKLLTAFSNSSLEKSFIVRKDLTRDGEIISGFYSKQQLACFFSDRKRTVQELKEQMQELLDSLYERTHQNKENNS